MNFHFREKSASLLKLEIIIQRLYKKDPRIPEIKVDFERQMKGFIGEQKVDYFTDLLEKRFTIIKGVTLTIAGRRFQKDTLILTNCLVFILEIKNYYKQITFDTKLDQCIHYQNEEEKGFRNPISQAETQRMNLQEWLQEQNLPPIPIEYYVAIADPDTIIKVIGDEQQIANVVTHGEHIPRKTLEKEAEAKKQSFPKIDHHKLGIHILKTSQKQNYDILKKFNLQPSDIIPGVICPYCQTIGMIWTDKNWHCNHCHKTSRRSHLRTIKEFLILLDRGISNKECRYFLKIKDRFVANRLLKHANLIYHKKYRRWYPKNKYPKW